MAIYKVTQSLLACCRLDARARAPFPHTHTRSLSLLFAQYFSNALFQRMQIMPLAWLDIHSLNTLFQTVIVASLDWRTNFVIINRNLYIFLYHTNSRLICLFVQFYLQYISWICLSRAPLTVLRLTTKHYGNLIMEIQRWSKYFRFFSGFLF